MGSSLAPDTPGTLGRRQLRARLHAVAQDSPLHTPTLASVSSGEPGTGPYLMELSDETSRSESSVSLGGGGGSLTGTAVKAGDFLEKNSRCHLGTGRKKTPDVTLEQAGSLRRLACSPAHGLSFGRQQLDARQESGVRRPYLP